MTTDSKPDSAQWFDPDTVLREEANAIHTGKPRPLNALGNTTPEDGTGDKAAESSTERQTAPAGAKPAAKVADVAPVSSGEPWQDIPSNVSGNALRIALYDRGSSALCLSGGGIRSASFNVGVIEALAVHPRPDTDTKKGEEQAKDHTKSFLSQFEYLSTVSGGGYIGSWLSAWIAREGYAKVWPKLVGRRERPEKEPSEIVWLRSYSNFLAPRKGLLSADTWTGFALVIRNLVLNWLVIIPVLCLALFAVKALAIGAYWVPRSGQPDLFWIPLFALVLLVWALRYALANRPSCNPGIVEATEKGKPHYVNRKNLHRADAQRDESARVSAGGSEARFKVTCLLPALVAAFLFSLGLAVRYFALEKYPLVDTVILTLEFSVPLYVAAWVIARVQVMLHPKENTPKGGHWYWFRDFLAWVGAGVVYGAFIGVGMHILATTFGAAKIEELSRGVCAVADICLSLQTMTMLALFVVGVPWIVTAQLTAEMIFVGLTNWQWDSDADREWFGRSTGWFTVAAIAWFFVTILVILGPPLVAILFAKFTWAKYGTVLLGPLSAALSTILGKSGKTSGTDQGPQKSPWWIQLILPVSTVVFLIFLVIAVSAAMDWLLFGHMLVESPLLGSGAEKDFVSDRSWLLIGIAGITIVAGFASAFININRFSIHSLYRNRLIRAYLGASNVDRAPNPFTGFDEADNKPMAELWSRKPKDGDTSWQPFHIVNIALNVVNSKRLAWQERKAESFTVSPLHCGTAGNELGYRPTRQYGDGERAGITLGTALAISGAAASPNMGYNSSPLVTLLLALFNVRLGWWLGNPGRAGDKTYKKDGPRVAIAPFLTEMFGQTTDDRGFVYLSDGGHFENLGLYEMIRRRCRCIVVSDAGADPDYDFTDLGNAVRKIAIDLGIYISFSDLREIKRRSKDNTVIKGAYYAIGEIDYKTAPERTAAPEADDKEKAAVEAKRQNVENGYILYIKPSYHGTESAGIVSYAAANAAFPHEPTFDLFYGESQFESYRTLGFEIVDSVLKQAKARAEEILKDPKRTWKPSLTSLRDLIAALAPGAKAPPEAPRLSDALKHLDPKDLEEVRTILAPAKT
jgi:hypothetical protein